MNILFMEEKMYAYIKGKIVEKSNNYVIVENNGIGYRIFMTITSIDKISDDVQEVKIFTYYQVREDNISLYGFLQKEELRMFELLLSVSGVGAKSAIAMLSSITPSDFAMAVIQNDTKKLTKIQGVGAKTAARIVLELKDKLKTEEAISKNSSEVQKVIKNTEEIDEASQALLILGYTKKEIDKAFEKLELDSISTQDIIKKALAFLGR